MSELSDREKASTFRRQIERLTAAFSSTESNALGTQMHELNRAADMLCDPRFELSGPSDKEVAQKLARMLEYMQGELTNASRPLTIPRRLQLVYWIKRALGRRT